MVKIPHHLVNQCIVAIGQAFHHNFQTRNLWVHPLGYRGMNFCCLVRVDALENRCNNFKGLDMERQQLIRWKQPPSPLW
jgi:hypothetical protein